MFSINYIIYTGYPVLEGACAKRPRSQQEIPPPGRRIRARDTPILDALQQGHLTKLAPPHKQGRHRRLPLWARHPRRPGMYHITFHCPLRMRMRRQPRNQFIRAREADTWEALDKALLIKDTEDGREIYVDGTELFVSYIFAEFTYRYLARNSGTLFMYMRGPGRLTVPSPWILLEFREACHAPTRDRMRVLSI